MVEIGQKLLVVIVVSVFAVLIPAILAIDWLEENVINPRIWKDWSCDEMQEYAMQFEDEKLSSFQRAQFHQDLSRCLAS